MVADTSALIAILLGEPERDRFVHLLAEADDPLISAATLVEASIVMLAKTGPDGVGDLDDLLAAAAVRCVAVDATQARIARDAFERFGKGRSAAGLNYRTSAACRHIGRSWIAFFLDTNGFVSPRDENV